MTLYIPTGATTYEFVVNLPNASGNNYLVIQSQYNINFWVWALTIVETNDRYTKFSMNVTEQERTGHFGGVYDYQIQNDVPEVLVDGLMKWINEEGEPELPAYISNNETKEANQFYTPNY